MYLRLPDAVKSLDNDFRLLAKDSIKRGKMEATLVLRHKTRDVAQLSDERLVELAQLFKRASDIFATQGVPTKVDLALVLSESSYLGIDNSNLVEQIKDELLDSFKQALVKLNQSRQAEGTRLVQALKNLLDSAKQNTAIIAGAAQNIKEHNYQKLLQKVAELNSQVALDPTRIEQEVLLLCTKMDIQEEIDRLNSHYVEFANLLDSTGPVGRRLDFLMQELNRESNTICSKSSDINIINSAINLKTIIEQIREQIQNLE